MKNDQTKALDLVAIFESLNARIAVLTPQSRKAFLAHWRASEKQLKSKLEQLRQEAKAEEFELFKRELRRKCPGGKVYYTGSQNELLGRSGRLKKVNRKYALVVFGEATWTVRIKHLSLEPDSPVRVSLQRRINQVKKFDHETVIYNILFRSSRTNS